MFGEKLKLARVQKKLKQSELAEKLNVRNTTISNWEKGISNPDIEIIDALCIELNVPASYFFDAIKNDEYFSFVEKEVIHKYRLLDEYGKKAVDTTLQNEYDRCSDFHFTSYEDAKEFMRSRPRYAMGGVNIERMDKEKLMKWANDFWIMEQEAKEYLD